MRPPKRRKTLILLLAVALLTMASTIPSAGSAQPALPQLFAGVAYIDDVPALSGTTVTALINESAVSQATVVGAGTYSLPVGGGASPGALITFEVGGHPARETAVFTPGGANVLDLHATTSPSTTSPPAPAQPITFFEPNYFSAQLQTFIARYILENGYRYDTSSVPVYDLGRQLAGLLTGQVDVLMEAWSSESGPWEDAVARGRLLSLGTSLGHHWESAFVIPAYLQEQYPDLDSVEDLKQQRYKDLFATAETGRKARLVSCVSSWQCASINAEQVTGYGLNEHVQIINPESESALVASINDSYERREPWLGYMWAFGPALLLDLVRLQEPPYSAECWETTKACAYEGSTILIVTNPSLPEQAPGAADFLRKWDFNFDVHLRSVALWQANNPGATIEDTALYWLKNNEAAWSSWVTPEAAGRIRSALSSTATPEPRGEPFARNENEDFSELGINDPEGIWSDGDTMWVSSPALDRILAFNVETKARVVSKDITSLAADNGDPQALWSDGKTMWVGEGQNRHAGGRYGWVYAYSLDINVDGTVGPDHGRRDAGKEFDPDRGSSPRGIWSDEGLIWISQSRTGVEGDGDIRAYRLNLDAAGVPAQDLGAEGPGFDFRGVVGEGLWSDGTTLWVAKGAQEQIHAYDLASGARVEGKDFGSVGGYAQGIWSDTATMWVAVGHRILAFNMPEFSENEPDTPGTTPPAREPEEPAAPEESRNHPDDLIALKALYQATGGPNWIDSTNWLDEDVPLEDWHGVLTDASTGRVTSLVLNDNNLGALEFSGPVLPGLILPTGELPAELELLSSLATLNLRNNRLEGELPPELGNLTNLKLLVLSGNRLEGRIPYQWGGLDSLINLTYLNLNDNLLEGEIPWQLGNRIALEYLYLRDNGLSGGIPVVDEQLSRTAGLTTLRNLRALDLNGNGLSGAIPAELAILPNLEFLYLAGNQLSGRVPPVWGGQLERLILTGNRLEGSIPSGLGDIGGLTHLYLDRNRLTGSIAPELGNLGNLRHLDLSYNDLEGPIPAELTRLSRLLSLILTGNMLDKPLPEGMDRLTVLESLYLNDNELEGEIPASLADLSNLERLYLHNNEFTDCTPHALKSLLESSLRSLRRGPGFHVSLPGFCSSAGELSDREVLMALYDAAGGDEGLRYRIRSGSIKLHAGWTRKTNWTSNRPLIEWDGVEEVNAEGRVVKLDLSDNNLRGYIPSEIAELEYLEELDLSKNRLAHQIPAELGHQDKLQNLTELHLYGNSFEGCVPLGERLRELLEESADEQKTAFDSSVRGVGLQRLIDLMNLRDFEVGGVPIIDLVTTLTEQDVLDLLDDELADALKNNRAIKGIGGASTDLLRGRASQLNFEPTVFDVWSILSQEWFTRMIDDWFGPTLGVGLPPCAPPPDEPLGVLPERQSLLTDWQALEDVRDHFVQSGSHHESLDTWNGHISDWEGVTLEIVDGQERVTRLDLAGYDDIPLVDIYGRGLKGEIPATLSTLGELKYLNLSNNELQGPIPSELGHLSNLEVLALNENYDKENIDPIFGHQSENIRFGLEGPIPPALGNLGSLKHLSLSNNPYLVGELPPEFGNLTNLYYVYFGGSPLSSCIPANLQQKFGTPILVRIAGEIVAMIAWSQVGTKLGLVLFASGMIDSEEVTDFTGSLTDYHRVAGADASAEAIDLATEFNSLVQDYISTVEEFARAVVGVPLNLVFRRSAALSDLGNVNLYCGSSGTNTQQ